MVEHEENRQKNMDNVVWELEQKVEKLEQGVQFITVNLPNKLTDDISTRINSNMLKYLPKIHIEIQNFKFFRERMEIWTRERDTEWSQKFESRQFFQQEMEFKVNNMKSEVDYLNRTFSQEKMAQLDQMFNDFNKIQLIQTVLETKVENCPSREEVGLLEKDLTENYATKNRLNGLKDMIDDFVTRE